MASFLFEFFDNEHKYEKHDGYWLGGRQCSGRRVIAGGTTKEAGALADGISMGGEPQRAGREREKEEKAAARTGWARGDARGLYRGCKLRHCKANPPL